MRFGMCCGIDRIPLVADRGYDYVELSMSGVLCPETEDDDFEPTRRQILAAALPCEVLNAFFPAELKITGPGVDVPRVKAYSATGMRRAREVGGKVAVVGSGAARNIPDGFPRDRAWSQLLEAFEIINEEAVRNEMVVAIEPLYRKACNVINSVPEAVRLAEELDLSNVKVLADLFHMDDENEPMSNVREAGDWMVHLHTPDTGSEKPGGGHYNTPGFFAALKAIGYDARISFERAWGDFAAEAGPALEFLKNQWAMGAA